MSALLEISTVVGCPMSCSYCPQKTHIKNYGDGDRVMALKTFRYCLDKVPHHVGIVFAGMVEPWTNPAATDMVLLAAVNHIVSVYTTCHGMSLDDVNLINKYGIHFNHFTIHLPDADGIMKLKVTDHYLSVLSQAIKIPGMNYTVIGNLHPEVEKITGPVHDGSKSLISRAGNIKDFFMQKATGNLMCSATGPKIDHNVLLPNGDVVLCCMDYSVDHVIGNLLTDSYDDLFKSEEYMRVMDGLKDDDSDILCRKCEIAVRV